MAITAIFESPGISQQQYDQALKDLEAAGLGSPNGRIHHQAAVLETGLFIVDIWESEEALGKFSEGLMPILVGTGATPAEPRILQTYNTLTN